MLIRQLTPADSAQHNMISSQAFIWKGKPEDLNDFPEKPVIGAFDDTDTTLFAQLELDEMQNHFCGKLLTCAGIGGVATKPEFRRTGAVRKLFEYIFEKDWDISILYPFSTSYYKKFGYESAGLALEVTADFSELSHIERSFSAELFDGSQLDKLLELYNNISQNNNLAFARNSSRYFSDKPFETTVYTYIWKNSSGEYKAYATYSVNREKSCIFVSEIGYSDKESLLGMLGFLRCYDGNQKSISFSKLPCDSPIIGLFQNLKNVNIVCHNIGSVRIINVENVLNSKLWPDEHGNFILRCNDSLSRNNATFEVEYQNGTCSINRCDKKPDLILGPTAFSSILLTGFDAFPAKLQYIEDAEFLTDCKDFIKAFPKTGAYFTDGF